MQPIIPSPNRFPASASLPPPDAELAPSDDGLARAPERPRPDLPRLHSRDLFRQGNLILIEHGGERYFLRMTRNNKLILTK